MTNPHKVAWQSIEKELLGDVCEVARRIPWGFQADRPSICNVTCEQFLESQKVFGTVILHILIGEGESLETFEKVFQHAYKHALKIIILEHSPSSPDWKDDNNVTNERIIFLQKLLDDSGERVRTKDLGRNIVHLLTTVKPLFIDQVSDDYIQKNLDTSWCGIASECPDGYYTHSSEFPTSHEIIKALPDNKDFYWVIGGLMFLASIPKLPNYKHKLVDAVLKQCLYARIAIEPDSKELISKLNTIYNGIADSMLHRLKNAPMSLDNGHWRNFYRTFGSDDILDKISSIEHLNVSDLDVSDQIVYTSTVPLSFYKHLKFNNWIITSIEGHRRDMPWLMPKREKTTSIVWDMGAQEVPKKIFFYWGNPVMSWLRYMTLYSFRKLNPDWDMELHVSHIDIKDKYWVDPNQQDFHTYKGKNYLSEVDKLGITIKECPVFVEGAGPSHNSNFFKWNELATNGGIYSDMDILYVEPIDTVYNEIKNHRYGLCIDEAGNYLIGFMFSKKPSWATANNRFFRHTFNCAKMSFNRQIYMSAGIGAIQLNLKNLCVNKIHHVQAYKEGMLHMDLRYVYPFRWTQTHCFYSQLHTELPQETVGIHWFAGSKGSQEFNGQINPENVDSFNNTMSYWLRAILNKE